MSQTIAVERLSKVYGTTQAIEDLTFSVPDGEILGFLGPNGAGKTTTMRILAGYLPATSGKAQVAGYDVREQSMQVRQRIGYLPEHPPLYLDMTVEGFLAFVTRIKGVPAGDRGDRINAAIAKCGLLGKRRTRIGKLSKGFRQRVGLAQAIVHDPPVIILDEPTVGLDPRQIRQVRDLIKSLAGDRTVLLSTHILPEVQMTCSRAAIINDGRVVAIDAIEALMNQIAEGSGYEVEVETETLPPEWLQNIPGVNTVEVLETGVRENRHRLRVFTEAGSEPGKEIAAAAIAAGMGLCEMRRTRASLEEVFLKLTTRDAIAIPPETVEKEGERSDNNFNASTNNEQRTTNNEEDSGLRDEG